MLFCFLILIYVNTLCVLDGQYFINIPHLDGRIVGGTVVDIEEYPFQVSLRVFGIHACGASIISNRHVVTAAHCYRYSASLYSIRAGSSYRITGGVIIGVDTIFKHPRYNSRTYDYDIAVVFLSSTLNFSISIAPLALPMENREVAEGEYSFVTGWGKNGELGQLSSKLQVVELPIVSQDSCNAFYAVTNSSITDRMICAGYVSGGKDACYGDSGGPMVIDGYLIGIVSWGEGCARANFPGVYSRVPALRSFITIVTGL